MDFELSLEKVMFIGLMIVVVGAANVYMMHTWPSNPDKKGRTFC